MEFLIEKGKSWFILAQIFIILAGFLFTTSGLAYSSGFDAFNRAVDLSLQNSTNLNTTEIIQIYGDLTTANLRVFKGFMIFASICVFLSLLFWIVGYFKF